MHIVCVAAVFTRCFSGNSGHTRLTLNSMQVFVKNKAIEKYDPNFNVIKIGSCILAQDTYLYTKE